MNPTNSDRRRFLIATCLTLLALPALWLVSRSADSGAPNVASVDVDVLVGETAGDPAGPAEAAGDAAADAVAATQDPNTAPVQSATLPPPAPAAPASTTPSDDTSDEPAAPVFLDGPSVQIGAAIPQVAVPASPAVSAIRTDATYRSTVYPADTCLVADVQTGRTITIVNLNNGRSVTCTATRTYSAIEDGLTMHPDLFSQIADLTDAPIPVEIRQ